MPQLDFANPLTTSQVVWMAVIFGVLYYLLSAWALPQVASVLDDRAARIGADLDSARLAKLNADTAATELQEANTVVTRLTGHVPDPALVGGAVDRAMTAKA